MTPFLEKQRNILDFALSSLLRRWGRNLALVAVYSGIVFFLGSVMFFTNALKHEAAQHRTQVDAASAAYGPWLEQVAVPLFRRARGCGCQEHRAVRRHPEPDLRRGGYRRRCGPCPFRQRGRGDRGRARSGARR